jgi:hypothetical protein
MKWIGSAIYDNLFPLLDITEVDRSNILSDDAADTLIRHGTTSELMFSPPVNECLPDLFTNTPRQVVFPRPFVAEFENSWLLGTDAIGMTADKKIITETTYRSSQITDSRIDRAKLVYDIGIDGRLGLGDSTFIEEPCFPLIDQWSHGYFHWIADNLSKLSSFEAYQDVTGKRPSLIIEPDPPTWKTESLKLLGFDSDDWIEWKCRIAHCGQLLVPSHRRFNHYISPASIQWLRDRVFQNIHQTRSDSLKIYISREDASQRKVLNEDEVTNFLSNYGFQTVLLSNLTFSEQVRIFSRADVVVAPHGAGLTNTIFSDDITLVEFFGSKKHSRSLCYYSIANTLGFDYYAFEAEPQGDDIHIDLDIIPNKALID